MRVVHGHGPAGGPMDWGSVLCIYPLCRPHSYIFKVGPSFKNAH